MNLASWKRLLLRSIWWRNSSIPPRNIEGNGSHAPYATTSLSLYFSIKTRGPYFVLFCRQLSSSSASFLRPGMFRRARKYPVVRETCDPPPSVCPAGVGVIVFLSVLSGSPSCLLGADALHESPRVYLQTFSISASFIQFLLIDHWIRHGFWLARDCQGD